MEMRERRLREVWARLAPVTDPELDESVTELRFVSGVAVDRLDRVHIRFRLPTYWCAANFAWIMAEDMRRAVQVLPWVRAVTVELDDHMYAAEINRGMRDGTGFRAAFGEAAEEGELEDIRCRFRIKAFQRRQDAVIGWLLEGGGCTVPGILALDRLGLLSLPIADAAISRLRDRYLEIRAELGGPSDRAFVQPDGSPITEQGFADYRRTLRSARVNVEFNGALCRGLLTARYPEPAGEEPGLAHFVAQAAGRRHAHP